MAVEKSAAVRPSQTPSSLKASNSPSPTPVGGAAKTAASSSGAAYTTGVAPPSARRASLRIRAVAIAVPPTAFLAAASSVARSSGGASVESGASTARTPAPATG